MSFIGRAETQVEDILSRLLNPILIRTQMPLSKLIDPKEFDSLNEEVQKHKFDIIIYRLDKPTVIVEVNYHHGEKAARKWRTIFDPMLKRYNYETLTINDYDCTHLFKPSDYTNHKDNWNDYTDVINALIIHNIPI